ncbi:MAG: class I SAM-dependent methyltransferase [bacterium]|nr:class I SAM-dependent methyltransferase [bacterium]
MKNILIKCIGYPATIIHGDCAVLDRWFWLRKNLLPGNLRTLDAGCGSGAFTMYAAKIGNEAVGISFDERNNKVATERAKMLGIKNIKFLDGDLRKLDQMSENLGIFDQIICCETIEHIINDQKLISDFAALLRPGGRLILTTPYKEYKPMVGDGRGVSTWEDGGHVRWGYTHKEMASLMENAGLEIKKEEYITGFISQQLINLERILCGLNYVLAWALVFPFRVLQLLDPFISKIINYPHLCIGVVAVKK